MEQSGAELLGLPEGYSPPVSLRSSDQELERSDQGMVEIDFFNY